MIYNIQPCKYYKRNTTFPLQMQLFLTVHCLELSCFKYIIFEITNFTLKFQLLIGRGLVTPYTCKVHYNAPVSTDDVVTHINLPTWGHHFQLCPCVRLRLFHVSSHWKLGGQHANYGHFNLIIKLCDNTMIS